MAEKLAGLYIMKKFNIRFICIVIIVWAADTFSKLWAVKALTSQPKLEFLGELLQFRLIYNTGGIFGVAPGNALVFQALTGMAITFLLLYYYKHPDRGSLFDLSISLVLGGALGNFTDRFFRPGVVDFIDMDFFDIPAIGIYRWPTYNIADAFISVGTVLMIISFLSFERVQAKKDKQDEERALHTDR